MELAESQASVAETGRDLLTIISLPKLLCNLRVVRPAHDADLHLLTQSLEELIQLWVDFLQTGKTHFNYHFMF